MLCETFNHYAKHFGYSEQSMKLCEPRNWNSAQLKTSIAYKVRNPRMATVNTFKRPDLKKTASDFARQKQIRPRQIKQNKALHTRLVALILCIKDRLLRRQFVCLFPRAPRGLVRLYNAHLFASALPCFSLGSITTRILQTTIGARR